MFCIKNMYKKYFCTFIDMMFDLIIQNQPNSEPVQCNVCKYVGGNFDTHYVRMLVKLLKRTHGSEITSNQFLFEKIR